MPDPTKHIVKMEDCEAILEYLYAACLEQGATWLSYHFTPVFESPTSRNTFIWTRDFPVEYQKRYISDDFRGRDPIPQLVFEHGPVLTWTEVRARGKSIPDVTAYLDDLEELGVDNWVAFALFGSRNRDGYATMRFAEDPDGFPKKRLQEIHSLMLSAHLQICKVMDEGRASVALSEREREVVEWMGRGKSSGDIAAILEISPETVRTYTRRVYDKLQTNDRVTATVRALKLGLIEL
jgi:LuxR family transcriptional regulator/LuxR family quorum-sensing system transcriptional regulator CciR